MFRSSPSPADSQSLRPDSAQRMSASLSLVSPSDLVGPSPVTSNGTETTEIEDEESDEVHQPSYRGAQEPQVRVSSPRSTSSEGDANHLGQLMMLKTNIPDQIRRSVNEESVSVIHAPESFRSWVRLPGALLLRLMSELLIPRRPQQNQLRTRSKQTKGAPRRIQVPLSPSTSLRKR